MMFSYIRSMFSYMLVYIGCSRVKHEESLDMQSGNSVGRLLMLEGTKPVAMVSNTAYWN